MLAVMCGASHSLAFLLVCPCTTINVLSHTAQTYKYIGNLLRTPDGRLCILDFGMTLDIDPDLQYSLLEYVAHLTAEDYDSLPEDFAKLGFLKADKLEFARRSGVLEPLKYFLKQIGQGGGAKRLRTRIFDEYREKYPGMSDDELRVEMRSEMKQRVQEVAERERYVSFETHALAVLKVLVSFCFVDTSR
jgi:hypothetical protein